MTDLYANATLERKLGTEVGKPLREVFCRGNAECDKCFISVKKPYKFSPLHIHL